MDYSREEWMLECERLEEVLSEIRIQLKRMKDAVREQEEKVRSARKQVFDSYSSSVLDEAQNIQKLYAQKQDGEVYLNALNRLERLSRSPYFGRIDFRREGEDKPKEIYIGISTLIERNTERILVYDWRAPICSLFYDHDLGPAEYISRRGPIRGEITLKRQYRIEDSELKYMFDTELKIDDQILQEVLAKSRSGKMQHIVTSIQREQNRVIRNDTSDLVIVQGAAGSGKTSIALHRVAYLLYRYREEVSAENIVLFSPNRIFKDYVSGVLPGLGEENMVQLTFRDLCSELIRAPLNLEGSDRLIADLLSGGEKSQTRDRMESVGYKGSTDYIRVIKNYIGLLERGELTPFRDIEYRGEMLITAEKLEELFLSKYSYLPFLRRVKKLKRRILFLLSPHKKERAEELKREFDEDPDLEFLSRGELARRSVEVLSEELDPLRERINALIPDGVLTLYRRLLSDRELFIRVSGKEGPPKNWEKMKERTLQQIDEGMLPHEDMVPLAYLAFRLEGRGPDLGEIRHLLIDEAQDYSPFHYELIEELFGGSRLTVLGDLNQSIMPGGGLRDYGVIREIVDAEDVEMIRLKRSYRSTSEIVNFTRALLPAGEKIAAIDRPGERPLLVEIPERKFLRKALISGYREMIGRGAESVAIIGKNPAACEELYESLAGEIEDLILISGEDDAFRSGSVLIPSYLTKGLEFDGVMVVITEEAGYCREEERLLLYTVCTRALHHLHIYHSRCGISPLFSDVDPELYQIKTCSR